MVNQVKIIDQRPAGQGTIEQRTEMGADGRRIMVAVVKPGINEFVSSGGMDQVMKQRYGIGRVPR